MRSNHEAEAEATGVTRICEWRAGVLAEAKSQRTGAAQEPAEGADASLARKEGRGDLGWHSPRRLTRGRVWNRGARRELRDLELRTRIFIQ